MSEKAALLIKKDGEWVAVPVLAGVSPVATVVETADGAVITITDKAGTTTATVKNGAKGDPGTNGTTPVKGTDYFTAADKADMVAQVKAALPKLTLTGVDADGVTHTYTLYGE